MGKNKTRTIWFTTKGGGQIGVHPENIRYLLSDHLTTKCGLTVPLDVSKWEEHQKALVNGCL